jgi:SsrA-binding protein
MKILATNKRARYDYEIGKTFIAGVVLSGQEVKSARSGAISLKGSFVQFRGHEAFLTNATISAYKNAVGLENYDPLQYRKLLLHKKQLEELREAIQSGGMSVLPLAMGLDHNLIKVELGLGRGKKRYDKRQTIKKRDMLRDAGRDVKPKR